MRLSNTELRHHKDVASRAKKAATGGSSGSSLRTYAPQECPREWADFGEDLLRAFKHHLEEDSRVVKNLMAGISFASGPNGERVCLIAPSEATCKVQEAHQEALESAASEICNSKNSRFPGVQALVLPTSERLESVPITWDKDGTPDGVNYCVEMKLFAWFRKLKSHGRVKKVHATYAMAINASFFEAYKCRGDEQGLVGASFTAVPCVGCQRFAPVLQQADTDFYADPGAPYAESVLGPRQGIYLEECNLEPRCLPCVDLTT